MKAQRKAIVAGLAAILSLGVASGVAWAQDTQGNMKLDNKSKVETQHKGKAGGQMKAEENTKMKGEAGGGAKAQANTKMKVEGKNAEMKSGSKQQNQMKVEEQGSSKKHYGSKAEMKPETRTGNKAASENGQSMKGNRMKTGEANSGTSNEKTGSVQKNGGVNVNISTQQKTEIRQVIKTEDVRPVEHVTFNVDVGTSIPHSVHLHRLPPRIVKIVPEYESYEYFVLADGRIIIVDPDTYEIVYILA